MRATLFFMIRMELKEPVTSAEHEVECVSSADLRRKNRFRDRLAQQQRELQFQLDPIRTNRIRTPLIKTGFGLRRLFPCA
jgi:hypothetical protein